jgi:FAD/FMN-containing dehydrogenase
MLRRNLLKGVAALSLATGLAPVATFAAPARRRVRPGDAGWPDMAAWASLGKAVGGRLSKIVSPWDAAAKAPDSPETVALFKAVRNSFHNSETPAFTQSLGWIDAWISKPSEYMVAAESAADVAEAVKFATAHNLRLVVKGGGHSYLGGSNAPDSLLIWTKPMRAIELHDAFVPKGCKSAPETAVSLGAGCVWLEAYDAVTTKAGRYVQGGGCVTVGVGGFVQGGGFGGFSKGFGTGASNLLEAEVVTADGQVRIANDCTNSDLFWALKGGGGGTFGVVTRLTLRTYDLPATFGVVIGTISAASDEAYRALVEGLLRFYRDSLLNPHWGEQIRFQSQRRVGLSMVFQGLSQAEAQATWKPFFDWVTARPDDYVLSRLQFLNLPARVFWNNAILKDLPGVVKLDDRAETTPYAFNVEGDVWDGDAGQAGQVLHGYQSTWLSKDLLEPARRPALVDALIHAANGWGVSLHCNKGMAGATPQAQARTLGTAMNPAVVNAFALAITGGEEPAAYPGVAGHEPNVANGRRDAKQMKAAMEPLLALLEKPASYVSETDYFEADWQQAFWGAHYARLKQIKRRYDPEGLFFVHHSVGSEDWSADGFERVT